MTSTAPPGTQDEVSRKLALAFAPLHKRAFGTAIGLALGLTIALMTIVVVVRHPVQGPNISLLREYFTGYSVSWLGALVGFGWGFLVGFVGGWFVAFCRNLIIAASVFVIRAKSELSQTRDFLDHI